MAVLSFTTRLYYRLRWLIPRRGQIGLRRLRARLLMPRWRDRWPIDPASSRKPDHWTGWPEGRQFALVLTHDVELTRGCERCERVADMEERLGFRSSFTLVPERYPIRPEMRHDLARRGFEIAIHGLKHDGKLYSSRRVFRERAARINEYLKAWNAVGFRSPYMHHNLDWIHDLDIEYDASTFDVDPFEPQPAGVGTIFPFWKADAASGRGYVELPYTLPQDLTVFVMMRNRSIDIWQRKLEWIAEQGGMALLLVHPDYMNFGSSAMQCDEYPASLYEDFLRHVHERYAGRYWQALPREVARFWAQNYRTGGR